MNWQQIQQLQQAGIAFGSHSAIHCSADSLSSGDLLRAAARSKAILEIRLGRAVSSIALPYGIYDARSETVLKLCDYQIAYTTQERRATLNDRPLRIPRIEVRGDVELDEFAAAVGIFPGTGSHAEAIRPGPDRLLVSVIIPAYNAAYTIAETLQSVCWQTYANLEIIVVDDGSGDETVAIVRQHAASDARIRLLQQENAGVAAARNAGIAAAQADYIALLDADDLWHSSKIERQMGVLLARGATVALVYTWYALIDDSGTIIGHSPQSLDEGNVFKRLCRGNLIGNGSSPLMRKAAVLECGGYDSGLKARGAQGCEDLKLYLALAERYEFAVVPDFLTGYRIVHGNMSSDTARMMRSYTLVMEPVGRRYPELLGIIRHGKAETLAWYLERALRSGRLIMVMPILMMLLRSSPLPALSILFHPRRGVLRRVAGANHRRRKSPPAAPANRWWQEGKRFLASRDCDHRTLLQLQAE
jgi:glycosyltransferase involved in cell wall biosynthesis